MKKRKLIYVCHEDYATDGKGRPVPCLIYADEHTPKGQPARDTATIDDLAELCDQDAEDRNAHDFCGVHQALAKLMLKSGFGEEATRLLMRDIAELGGLQGMNNICQH